MHFGLLVNLIIPFRGRKLWRQNKNGLIIVWRTYDVAWNYVLDKFERRVSHNMTISCHREFCKKKGPVVGPFKLRALIFRQSGMNLVRLLVESVMVQVVVELCSVEPVEPVQAAVVEPVRLD